MLKQPNGAQAKPRNDTPDAAEWGRLRSYLARQGVKQATINEVLAKCEGRNRAAKLDALRDLYRTL